MYPTGPSMLGKLVMDSKTKLNLDMKHYKNGGYIVYNNRFVLSTEYPEYDSERNSNHYSILWNKRQIYS